MKRLAALAAMKLSYFFSRRGGDEFFKSYSHLISADVTEEEVVSCPQEPEELFF